MTKEEWIKIYNAKDGTWDKDDLIDKAYEIITSPIKTNYDLINRQKAEIERLEEMLDSSVSSERNAVDNIDYEKTEVIKEFAHLVIERSRNEVIQISDIPDLVKEMTEENEK